MPAPDPHPDKAPPLFGTWRRAYAVTLAVFAIEVALLYGFTRYFSP